MNYRHTQVGWPQRALLIVVATVMSVIAWRLPETEPLEARLTMVAVAVVLLALSFWVSMLTIVIERDRLRWHFGLGFPRHSLQLSDIEAVEPAQTRWWLGWGVRWTPRGWFYTVAGRDVIVIHRRGARPVMLGTDEPQRLLNALNRAREKNR